MCALVLRVLRRLGVCVGKNGKTKRCDRSGVEKILRAAPLPLMVCRAGGRDVALTLLHGIPVYLTCIVSNIVISYREIRYTNVGMSYLAATGIFTTGCRKDTIALQQPYGMFGFILLHQNSGSRGRLTSTPFQSSIALFSASATLPSPAVCVPPSTHRSSACGMNRINRRAFSGGQIQSCVPCKTITGIPAVCRAHRNNSRSLTKHDRDR